jgi:hypothetical protein
MSYKHPINTIIKPNPVTTDVRSGIILLYIVGLEPTRWILMADLEHLVAIMERPGGQSRKDESPDGCQPRSNGGHSRKDGI